jgi:hypothetical protein
VAHQTLDSRSRAVGRVYRSVADSPQRLSRFATLAESAHGLLAGEDSIEPTDVPDAVSDPTVQRLPGVEVRLFELTVRLEREVLLSDEPDEPRVVLVGAGV